MNTLSVVVLAAVLAYASAGVFAPAIAPVAYAVPAIHPVHHVAPLAIPHPISYAPPAHIVKQFAYPVAYAAPVVKHVYAAPVVKHIAPVYAAPAFVKHHHFF